MSPQKQQEYRTEQQQHQSSYPTSPWTEAYQAMPTQDEAAERRFDSETQAPTHDALSDIYNRGF